MTQAPSSTPYLAGQFLLALPGIGDDRFDESVIAICAHDAEGALGLCLHETVPDMTVRDLMEQIGIDPRDTPPAPVHIGGPVEQTRGLVLHSTDWSGQDTRYAGTHWALSGSRDVLSAIAEQRGPSRWIVCLGYAGWSSGQLERELCAHGWFTMPGTESVLWQHSAENRWTAAYQSAGIDPAYLSFSPGSA